MERGLVPVVPSEELPQQRLNLDGAGRHESTPRDGDLMRSDLPGYVGFHPNEEPLVPEQDDT